MFSSFISLILVWFKARNVIPGPITQSVVSPTAGQEIASSISARSHTFMEIDHEIISTLNLLPLIQEGLLSVFARSTG